MVLQRFVELADSLKEKGPLVLSSFINIPVVLLPEHKQNNFGVVVLNRKNLSQCAVSMYLSRFYREKVVLILGNILSTVAQECGVRGGLPIHDTTLWKGWVKLEESVHYTSHKLGHQQHGAGK